MLSFSDIEPEIRDISIYIGVNRLFKLILLSKSRFEVLFSGVKLGRKKVLIEYSSSITYNFRVEKIS